ncbi:hypothetical protein AgCh_014637 [Apium graveolens]
MKELENEDPEITFVAPREMSEDDVIADVKPDALKWKTKPILNYNELEELFAKDKATCAGAVTAKKKNKRRNTKDIQTYESRVELRAPHQEIGFSQFGREAAKKIYVVARDVKDLKTGQILLRGENKNDVYYAISSATPQLNNTQLSTLESWHSRLGHPVSPILRFVEHIFPFHNTSFLRGTDSSLPSLTTLESIFQPGDVLRVPSVQPDARLIQQPSMPEHQSPLQTADATSENSPPNSSSIPTSSNSGSATSSPQHNHSASTHVDHTSSLQQEAPPQVQAHAPRTTRPRKPNSRYFNDPFVNHTTIHHIPQPLEPTSVTQALKDPKWRLAMSSEFDALIHNGTWDLVPYTNQNVISCKWIFRIKRNPDGSVNKYKARLVAKGFQQRPGIEDSETFSPVTKPATIRIILSIALSCGWPLRQLDINNAFLNGNLDDEVYMMQPPGFLHPSIPNFICRLRKAIYGLRQAPREWYIALKKIFLESGFKNSLADASLFIYNNGGIICYFLVYVDDIVLTGNNSLFLDKFI